MTDLLIRSGASLIDTLAAIVVALYAVRALLAAATSDTNRARLLMADGVIAALTLSVAATLLKVFGLHGWQQIGMFAFVLAFRTVMKRVFMAERKLVTGGQDSMCR